MQIRAIIAAFLFSSTAAFGSTVTLDFNSGFTQQTNNFGLGGKWSSGFNLSATTQESTYPGFVANLNSIQHTGWNSGQTENVSSLTFTRSNGGKFNLKSLNIPSFQTNLFADWSGIDNATGQRVSSTGPVFWDMISLTGTRSNGQVISQSLSPWNSSTIFSGSRTVTNPNPTIKVTGFSNLTSLTLSAVGNGLFGNTTLMCSPLNLSFVDPRFGQSGYCSGTVDPNGPLSNVSVYSELGGRNDLGVLNFNGATFNVAAVPIPAGALLLLSALVGLGFVRRQGSSELRG